MFLKYSIAPSFIDKFASGISFETSGSYLKPKPLQSLQAPIGELNENSLGSSSGIEKLHLLHEWFKDKISSSLSKTKQTEPFVSFVAFSMPSYTLDLVIKSSLIITMMI